jgi:lipopolysaccharide export system permease protein
MKKLHLLIIRSYIGPFFVTFFIALFILLMQFLWKYIDDLVGKGLEWHIIAELLFYASGHMVPMALPLAVLLSSIMTMGSLGEHYELVALKSAGISLQKIMTPLVIISMFIVVTAFFFSNNVLPVSNLKMMSLLYDVRHHRPAFNIVEGVYYKGIENYVIKVGQKESDGETLRNIKIYDHTDKRGNVNVTIAEWGTMAMTEDRRYLVLSLFNGTNYKEGDKDDPLDPARPLQRTHFQQQYSKFDLSGFEMHRTDEALFKSNFQMLNLRQLVNFEDSLSIELQRRKDEYVVFYKQRLTYYQRLNRENLARVDTDNIPGTSLLPSDDQFSEMMIDRSMNMVRNNKDHSYYSNEEFRQRRRTLARYQIEFHRKFTLSFACLVLFLIGAPLGAIIRKGGFGLPLVISVIFFVFFHVLSIMGEKFVREGVLEAHQGMWIAPLILLPLGIWLTYKATTDSALLDTESYTKKFERITRLFSRKWQE